MTWIHHRVTEITERDGENQPMKRLLLALTLLVAASAHAKLDFVEDDYATALARAKSKNVPVFVEAWAPW